MTKAIPTDFSRALNIQMRKHGDTARSLYRILKQSGRRIGPQTIRQWQLANYSPNWGSSLDALGDIEKRYGLPTGYFTKTLPVDQYEFIRRVLGQKFSGAQQRVLRWHLPKNFVVRPTAEQLEILAWVRTNVFAEEADFSRYMSKAHWQPYAVHFSSLGSRRSASPLIKKAKRPRTLRRGQIQTDIVEAPRRFADEMEALIKFKTSKLSQTGFKRYYVWSPTTAIMKMRHLGLMFGALVASPNSVLKGLGISPDRMTLALLVFPGIWDWYLVWAEKRRGFYTLSEVNLLSDLLALTRPAIGWLRQNPQLLDRVVAIPNIISRREIARARSDWNTACESAFQHGRSRLRDVKRVAKCHRDPFYALLPVLDTKSPLVEYRKIADEILRRMPNRKRLPLEAAEATRAYLMLRLGMHLGLRQKNLRQLLFSKKNAKPRSERQLLMALRGELRWNDREKAWEVFIPYQAFKNHYSTFFDKKPYRICLPNTAGLYTMIDDYIECHRPTLLEDNPDPGTFFIRSLHRLKIKNQEFSQTAFCDAWKVAIQRYGIKNPYTGKGAIRGLLPHGPHGVRDVVATHVVKQTGSYELASYSIQATPDVVAAHYARFFPYDKAAQAAKIVNKVWKK